MAHKLQQLEQNHCNWKTIPIKEVQINQNSQKFSKLYTESINTQVTSLNEKCASKYIYSNTMNFMRQNIRLIHVSSIKNLFKIIINKWTNMEFVGIDIAVHSKVITVKNMEICIITFTIWSRWSTLYGLCKSSKSLFTKEEGRQWENSLQSMKIIKPAKSTLSLDFVLKEDWNTVIKFIIR